MSRYRVSGASNCKIYVGDLGSSASSQELKEAFSYYGKIQNVWVARNPPGYAFVEFEDPRDAEDAMRGLDGRTVCGRKVRVEMSRGSNRYRGPAPYQGRPDDRCFDCGEKGHFARDCHRYRSGRSGRRRRSRSESRSRSRDRRSRSLSSRRSPKDRSGSYHRNPRNKSKDRSKSRSRSHSR